MDNCSLDVQQVKDLQDDLNYYLDSNQDPEFLENDLMYEDIELDDAQTAMYQTPGINTLRFLLSVCLCVTDVGVAVTNLRVVCKIIACRVQNYRVRSSCHRNFLEM